MKKDIKPVHYKPHLKGDANDRTAVIIISIIIRSTDISLDNIFFFSSGSSTYRCSSSRLYRLNVTTDFITAYRRQFKHIGTQ